MIFFLLLNFALCFVFAQAAVLPGNEAEEFRRFLPNVGSIEECRLDVYFPDLTDDRITVEEIESFTAEATRSAIINSFNIRKELLGDKKEKEKEVLGEEELDQFCVLEDFYSGEQSDELVIETYNLLFNFPEKYKLRALDGPSLADNLRYRLRKQVEKSEALSRLGSFSHNIKPALDQEPLNNNFLRQTVNDSACVLGGQLGVALHIPKMRSVLKEMIQKEDADFVWFRFPVSERIFPNQENWNVKVRKEIHRTKISPVMVEFEQLSDYALWFNLIAKAYDSCFKNFNSGRGFLWYKPIFDQGFNIYQSPLWGTYLLQAHIPFITSPDGKTNSLNLPRMIADHDGNVYVTIFKRQDQLNYPFYIEKLNVNKIWEEREDVNNYYVVKVPLKGRGYISTITGSHSNSHQICLYFDVDQERWIHYDNQFVSVPKEKTVEEVNNGYSIGPDFEGIKNQHECYITVADDRIWDKVFAPENMIPLKYFDWTTKTDIRLGS